MCMVSQRNMQCRRHARQQPNSSPVSRSQLLTTQRQGQVPRPVRQSTAAKRATQHTLAYLALVQPCCGGIHGREIIHSTQRGTKLRHSKKSSHVGPIHSVAVGLILEGFVHPRAVLILSRELRGPSRASVHCFGQAEPAATIGSKHQLGRNTGASMPAPALPSI